MSCPKIAITDSQRYQLEKLWFIYGNRGKKHTHSGHRFIQCILEDNEDCRKFFKPDEEVTQAVDEILQS